MIHHNSDLEFIVNSDSHAIVFCGSVRPEWTQSVKRGMLTFSVAILR